MPTGAASAVGSGYVVMKPSGVILATAPAWLSVHHSAPSGPAVISAGMLPAASGNSAVPPSRLIRPIRSAASRVYHSDRSGPAHNPYGGAADVATGTEETVPGRVDPADPPVAPAEPDRAVGTAGQYHRTALPGAQAHPADLPVRTDAGELAALDQAGPCGAVGGHNDAIRARSDVVFGDEHCPAS